MHDALERLLRLWADERRASAERYRAARRDRSFASRVSDGVAIDRCGIDAIESAAGGRYRLWLELPRGLSLDDVRIRPGEPLLLWWDDPDEPAACRALASRGDGRRLSIVVDGEVDDRVLEGGFRIDRESPETTFDRGDKAIRRMRDAKPTSELGRLRAVLFGDAEPSFARPVPVVFIDDALDAHQRDAVTRALHANEVSLVHGPPGTGKTRTLVEIVRQMVARGERVLCAAASNAATDHLGALLLAAGVPVVRIGHPARVDEAMMGTTLDAIVESSESSRRARALFDEAGAIRRGLRKVSHRAERRERLAEARAIERDARGMLAVEESRALARAKVVLVTAGSADARALLDVEIERVVLDEATQCVDPLALVAMARGVPVVLAGDPEQLPPTVLGDPALSSTIFARLRDRFEARVTSMLTVQHRMSDALVAYPSASMYRGRLVSAPANRARSLADLAVREDPSRDAPFIFLDVAGRGYEEARETEGKSVRNPEQADRVAREARRLLERGVPPRELAVIAAYDAQVRLLRARLVEARALGVEIGTVDGFQGREKDVVIVDLVRSNDQGEIGFLADVRRMNVAITRARRFLLVVGDAGLLARHPYYAGLVAHAEATGGYKSAWEDDADLPLGSAPDLSRAT